MKKAFCVLSLLAIVAVASATIEVRIWVTTASPAKTAGGPINFRATFGPFTPFTTRTNLSGTFDVHRNFVSSPGNLGSVNKYQTTVPTIEKFNPTQIPDVVEPGVGTGGIAQGTPVYIWAAFSGTGYGADIIGYDPDTGDPIYGPPVPLDPIKPGIGWETKGQRVQAFSLHLKTTGSLTLAPQWYQYENGATSTTVSELRWAETSDMTGNEVKMVGLGTGTPPTTGWYAGDTAERMQTWALDTTLGWPHAFGDYGAGGILLGAVNATGGGDMSIALGYDGINSTDAGGVVYFPGASNTGIDAGVIGEGSPDRVPPTPQATWIPEPASLLLLGLGVLALRRR